MGRVFQADDRLMGEEAVGFLGVNLRRDRLSLADEELAKAINADLHSQLGSIVLRLGRTKQFTTALADTVIRRLAKINALRYRVAGRAVYRAQTSVLTGLSANLFTTLLGFRPLNDRTTWAFMADDALMRKDDGTTLRTWGIAAPTVTPVVDPATGTLNGAYSVRYTYLRKTSDGKIAHESNPSPVSRTLSLAAGAIAINDLVALRPTDAQVTHLRFYRTVADGVVQLFDTEVAVAQIPQATDPADPLDTTGIEYADTAAFELTEPPYASRYTSGFERDLCVNPFGHVAKIAITQGTYQVLNVWEKEFLQGATTFTEGSIITTEGVRTPLSAQITTVQGTYAALFAWEVELLKASVLDPKSKAMTAAGIFAIVLGVPDSSLGTAVETDNDAPPLASWVAEFQGHVLLCRDAANPHYLWISKRFRPESIPADHFLEIGEPSDPLQCVVALAGLAGVFTRQTKYRLSGSTFEGLVFQEALTRRGTPAPLAVRATERGIIFPARDGVFLTNLLAPDQELSAAIAPLFVGETVNGFAPINWAAVATMAADVWKGRYFLALPTGLKASPDLLAVYSRDTGKWYFYDHPCRSLLTEEDTDTLTAGFTDGFVYTLETGETDAGATIALDCETKDYGGGVPTTRKLFLWLRVDAETQGEALTVELYVDGVLKRTTTVTGTRTRALIGFPEGSMGYLWRARLRYTGTKRVRVYGVEALGLPLEAA